MNDTEELWISCSEALREQVSDAIWQAYLSGITPVSIGEGEIVLGVPNTLIRDRVESRFLGLIQDTLTGTVGRDLVVQLEVVAPVVEKADEPPAPRRDPEEPVSPVTERLPARQGQGGAVIGAVRERHDQLESPVLDPRYTFDTFVIASSNRFAHAAAQSVAESPAQSYNPLFIYGDAGLGKTHLLHAIGNYVLENFSGRHVRYVSTETFMNEFVDAIRTNATTAFKRRYRECDVLLIDDVQFMERKEVAPRGVLPHLQLPLRRLQTDRAHLGPSAQVHRHPGGPPPEPVPVRPHHRSSSPRSSRPGWPSSRPRRSTSRSTYPTTCSISSPPTSRTTSGSWRGP